MSKKLLVCLSIVVLTTLVFSACAPTTVEITEPAVVVEEPAGSGGGDGSGGDKAAEEIPAEEGSTAALTVTGKVETEQSWSEEEVKSLPTLDVESTNSKGETETYSGVLISDILALASPKPNAETLVLIADDGFSAEIPLADILACENCILSFRSKGGFSSVIPGAAKNLQVKGVVELQVK